MSQLYKVLNGFDSVSGAAFGGGGGGGGRGDQSRRAEAVRSANAARARAAAATAAANQRQKEQNEANRQREIQATIRAAEKKEATRQANIAAASAKLAEERRVNQAREAHAAYTARVKAEEKATKAAYTAKVKATTKAANALTSHVNDNDGIDVSQLNEGQIYITARQLQPLNGNAPALHASTLYFDDQAKEWTTLSGFEKEGKLVRKPGTKSDKPENEGMIVKAIVDTNGISKQAYIQSLIKIDKNYDNQLPYFAVPSLTEKKDYNSNGYVNGMHQKAGGKFISFDGENARMLPGFTNAVPFK